MLLKTTDNKQSQIDELKALLSLKSISTKQQELISKEISNLSKGLKGEKDSAYEIDFHLKESKNWVIIHDLRIEHNGRVAQIDHLLINRLLEAFVIETKNFSADLQINEEGEFTAWYNKKPFGIPSPISQNQKHIAVLQDLVKNLPLPTRLGMQLTPVFFNVIMVSNTQRITRPKKLETKNVIKSEQIKEWVTKSNPDDAGIGHIFSSFAKMVSSETLEDIGRTFLLQHKPLTPNYNAKFSIHADEKSEPEAQEKPIVEIKKTTKIASFKLASKLGISKNELLEKFTNDGLLEVIDDEHKLTEHGKRMGGELKYTPKTGSYFLWPEDLLAAARQPAHQNTVP